MSESDIEQMVEEAKKPGKFNILNVLRDKAFPTDEIEIFIDEDAAFMAAEVEEQIKKFAETMDKTKDTKVLEEFTKRHDELTEKLEKIVEEMGNTRYVIHIEGISEGRREDIYEEALARFPMEYETENNPFAVEQEKKEKPNTKRDRYFTNMLWQAHIRKIVAPDGSVQEGITLDEAIELRRALPLASIGKVTESIEKMRIATAVFMMQTEENFLAKS